MAGHGADLAIFDNIDPTRLASSVKRAKDANKQLYLDLSRSSLDREHATTLLAMLKAEQGIKDNLRAVVAGRFITI